MSPKPKPKPKPKPAALSPVVTAETICAVGLALNERAVVYTLKSGHWVHLVTIAKTLKACRLALEVEYVDEDTIRVLAANRTTP